MSARNSTCDCEVRGLGSGETVAPRILRFSPRRMEPPSSGEDEEDTMGEIWWGRDDASAEKKTSLLLVLVTGVTTSSHVPCTRDPEGGPMCHWQVGPASGARLRFGVDRAEGGALAAFVCEFRRGIEDSPIGSLPTY